MQTLYDLLGALPQDDADGLRAAFREAAKASHPDNNPDDPDAPQRFRQIARAYSILRDETQRATYDSLLGEAQHERSAESRRRFFAEIGLPGPIGSMVIAFVSIAAFVVLERAVTASVIPAQWQQVLSAPVKALTAALPMQASNTVGRAGEHDKSDKIPSAKEPEIPSAVAETTGSFVVATADPDAMIPAMTEPPPTSETPSISEPLPISVPVVKDATYYRERGNLAYRSGDLPLALTDFDLSLNLDPSSSETYLNRAIVFRRLGDLRRALADVSQARRIDERKPQ